MGTNENRSVEIRVIGLAGSLRPESATRAAVQYALHGAAEEGAKVSLTDLAAYNLPFLGHEREEANLKTSGRNMRGRRAFVAQNLGVSSSPLTVSPRKALFAAPSLLELSYQP